MAKDAKKSSHLQLVDAPKRISDSRPLFGSRSDHSKLCQAGREGISPRSRAGRSGTNQAPRPRSIGNRHRV